MSSNLPKIYLHNDDIPENISLGNQIAIDTETLGLNPSRDRLCLVQINDGNEFTHLIRVSSKINPAPNLIKILESKKIQKLFHFARFDVAVMTKSYGVTVNNIYCTKIASKIARTYTDKHSLKSLCDELLNISLSKEEQSSDWGAEKLTENQKKYAANDVIYLHKIKQALDSILERENRIDLAKSCFEFINTQVELDLRGWGNQNIFDH
ncbi:MAG: ribonuclease D [Hyphomicrobiales bacterium]|nr:MAG: ribonuclease D [Hyphomicrobiales bacterium]